MPKSVDYARLTALLIEATKQQQAEIASALREIKSLRETDTLRETRTQREIKSQQATIRKQAATIAALKSDIRDGAENLKQVKQQLASHQSAPTPHRSQIARWSNCRTAIPRRPAHLFPEVRENCAPMRESGLSRR